MTFSPLNILAAPDVLKPPEKLDCDTSRNAFVFQAVQYLVQFGDLLIPLAVRKILEDQTCGLFGDIKGLKLLPFFSR